MTRSYSWQTYRDEVTRRVMHPVSTLVFIRALTVAVLLKMLWQWPSQAEFLSFHQLRLPRGVAGLLLVPARFAQASPHLFFSGALVFLMVHLVLRRNYLTALLMSVLTFNLMLINVPTGNGADPVAFMLSLWAIFLVPPRTTASPYTVLVQTTVYNMARLGCMLQFVFLYAASGVDKLKSNVWTTASAFESMRGVGGIINPDFPTWFATPLSDFVITWGSIALEILFGVLIWFRTWQPRLILAAILFHLGIWWMLDLPHFALIMIVAVSIFIRDDQYRKVFKPWLLSA